MGNIEKELNIEQEQTLEDFQQEIQELKDKEIKEKSKEANPDLISINQDELSEADFEIWQWAKGLDSENITKDDFTRLNKYRESINIKKEPSRDSFAQVLANKFAGLFGYKDIEEKKFLDLFSKQ